MPGSGRKKGTLNKNASTLREALDRHGFDLVQEYIDLLGSQKDPDKRRADIKFLFQFIYPALKEAETLPAAPTQVDNPASSMPTENLVSLVRSS